MDNNNNPLNGIRVCLIGKFSIPTKSLNKLLRQKGVLEPIDRVISTSTDVLNSKPVKEGTNLLVVGTDAPEDCLRRYELNCHDGYKAVKISEDELYALIRGEISIEIPRTIVKHIDLDYSYYCWTAPAHQIMHKSSPFVYDMNSVHSPVYGHELFIPDMDGINTHALGQIVGNLGGFSNNQNLPNSDMIMLPDKTVENLKRGIKDTIIQKIESDYNKGTSKMFCCCFTCFSDFMKWVHFRLSQCPDSSTQELVNRLYK